MTVVSAFAHRLAVACQERDEAGLAELLDRDVVALSDGGGRARAHQPIVGPATVASELLALAVGPDAMFKPVPVRGQTGLLVHDPHRVIAVVGLAARKRGVVSLWIIQRSHAVRAWNRHIPATCERDERGRPHG